MIGFDSKLFAQKIATERIISRNISLRQAAEEIDISSATLCRYELAKTIPDVLSYFKICEWLDCEFETFIKPYK